MRLKSQCKMGNLLLKYSNDLNHTELNYQMTYAVKSLMIIFSQLHSKYLQRFLSVNVVLFCMIKK